MPCVQFILLLHILYQILAFNKKFLNLTFRYFANFFEKSKFSIILWAFLYNFTFISFFNLLKIKRFSLLNNSFFLYLIRRLIHHTCKSFWYFRCWIFFNLISKYFGKDLNLFIILLQLKLSLLDQLVLIWLLYELRVLSLILRCRVITRY
jgi:hypothetical protein